MYHPPVSAHVPNSPTANLNHTLPETSTSAGGPLDDRHRDPQSDHCTHDEGSHQSPDSHGGPFPCDLRWSHSIANCSLWVHSIGSRRKQTSALHDGKITELLLVTYTSAAGVSWRPPSRAAYHIPGTVHLPFLIIVSTASWIRGCAAPTSSTCITTRGSHQPLAYGVGERCARYAR